MVAAPLIMKYATAAPVPALTCCDKRTGPQDLEGFGARKWFYRNAMGQCPDVNAARNNPTAGHRRLAGGIPVLAAKAADHQG